MFATSLRRIGALTLITLTALLALAAVARASSIEIGFPDGQPIQDAPTILHLTGTVGDGGIADAQAHVAPLDDTADCRDMPGPFTRQFSEPVHEQTFDLAPTITFARPGKWLVCAWVAVFGFGDDGAVASTVVDVRAPHVQVQLAGPRSWHPGRSATVSIRYSAEVSRQLFVVAVHGPCGHSWRAAKYRSAALLLAGRPVVGDGSQDVTARLSWGGSFRLCAYLQRDAADGDAGAVSGFSVDVGGRRRPRAPRRSAGGWELGQATWAG
jgi:hypothetical protein